MTNKRLSVDALSRLTDALLDIDEMANGPSRRQIMSYMDVDLRSAIPDVASARAHVVAWLRTCSDFDGGRDQLIQTLLLGTPDNEARRRFLTLLDELWPDEGGAAPRCAQNER